MQLCNEVLRDLGGPEASHSASSVHLMHGEGGLKKKKKKKRERRKPAVMEQILQMDDSMRPVRMPAVSPKCVFLYNHLKGRFFLDTQHVSA